MKKTLLYSMLVSCILCVSNSFAATHMIIHNQVQSTISYVAGDVLEFYTSVPGEYAVTTSAGSVIGFTVFSNSSELAAQYTLTGTETMASITLRIPTNLPPPSQPYTFSPTVVNLAAGCNINIPDANFKSYLVNNTSINTNGDAEIQCSEASAFAGSIDCSNLMIADLTGIEAFTSLTSLSCYNNQMTSLDLSNNLSLNYLICSSNQLTSLNLGTNTLYTTINCATNQLTNLDISNCDALTTFVCDENHISSLDLSGKTALTNLQCGMNTLNSLDVSDCTDLTTLVCYQNNLSTIDVSNNTGLIDLRTASNPINNLDVSMLPSLKYLYCMDNGLTTLDVSANTDLLMIDFSNNAISTIDLSVNNALLTVGCTNTTLTDLDLTNNVLLQGVAAHHGVLESVNLQNGNNQAITYVAFMNNPNLHCIQVDDAAYSTANWSGQVDATTSFNTDCSGVNGLDEESVKQLSVYPNPTAGLITLQSLKPVSFSLTHVNGTILSQNVVNGTFLMDLSTYACGVYFIKTKEGQTMKIIKE